MSHLLTLGAGIVLGLLAGHVFAVWRDTSSTKEKP